MSWAPSASNFRRNNTMPRSTLSAVATPGSDNPSSTSVMATAGCMPTRMVSAPRIFPMLEMSLTMRPMNESTISSVEMSMSTPRLAFLTMAFDRSSCSLSAIWSCMSIWIVTSRNSPIRSIGTFSTWQLLLERIAAGALQRKRQRVGEIRFRRHSLQIHAQVHDGLRDLRAHARDDAFRAHESQCRHGLEQMLRDQRVDRG